MPLKSAYRLPRPLILLITEPTCSGSSGHRRLTRLQEYFAKKGLKVIYQDSSHGPDHNKNFSSEVLLNDEVIGAGDGKSKKSAQQSAAKDALAKLDA